MQYIRRGYFPILSIEFFKSKKRTHSWHSRKAWEATGHISTHVGLDKMSQKKRIELSSTDSLLNNRVCDENLIIISV